MEVESITKAANFKSFLHLSYNNTRLLFQNSAFLYFHETKLTDCFGGLHKNMNCVFSLTSYKAFLRNKKRPRTSLPGAFSA